MVQVCYNYCKYQSWQNARVLFSKEVAIIISVPQLGGFEYPVTVITVDSAHLWMLKN